MKAAMDKISSNTNPYNHYTKPTFTSTRVRQLDELGNVIFCNYTNMNRADTNWSKLARFLYERFKNPDRVKLNMFGCSDGSDAYTLAINLIKELGNKARKFFPIYASDIAKTVVKEAQERKILLHERDLEFLRKIGAYTYFERDYAKPMQIMRGIEFYPHKVKPVLADTVEFSVKDVRESSALQDFSNQFVSFRNGWAYNTLEKQEQIAKNLFNNSNKKTIVMIGQSDLFKSGASDALQRNGFSGIKSEIFTEAETNYPSNLIGTPETKALYPEFILFEKGGK